MFSASASLLEKFNYFEDTFTIDGRYDKELDVQSGRVSAIMRALHYSVTVFIITSLETQLRFYARLCHDTWHTALKWEYGSLD